MSNERKLDPEKFALAVVSSSGYQQTVADKLQLYMEAYEAVEEFLKQVEDSSDY